jgi:hypothetical protein
MTDPPLVGTLCNLIGVQPSGTQACSQKEGLKRWLHDAMSWRDTDWWARVCRFSRVPLQRLPFDRESFEVCDVSRKRNSVNHR